MNASHCLSLTGALREEQPRGTEALRIALFRIAHRDRRINQFFSRWYRNIPVSINGLRFALYPSHNATERKIYIQRKLPEAASLQKLAELLEPKPTLFIDIGANCGLYSLYLARLLAPGSTVMAFEPNPTMYHRLCANLELNTLPRGVDVQCHAVALAEQDGTVELHLHDRNLGQSSIRNIERSQRSVQVPQRTLASYLNERDRYASCLIKIDVEGREDSVLYDYLDAAPDTALPNAILIEDDFRQCWTRDLFPLFERRSYRQAFSADGNRLWQL